MPYEAECTAYKNTDAGVSLSDDDDPTTFSDEDDFDDDEEHEEHEDRDDEEDEDILKRQSEDAVTLCTK